MKHDLFYWFTFLHGWSKASLIPVRTFSTFKASVGNISIHETKWQGFLFAQRKKEEGDMEETKWQEACSASTSSDWRADGPTGEVVFSLRVRSEYWYMHTAALPPSVLYPTTPRAAENKCRQHWSTQTKHNNCQFQCPQPKQAGWYKIVNGCIPTLLLQETKKHSWRNSNLKRFSKIRPQNVNIEMKLKNLFSVLSAADGKTTAFWGQRLFLSFLNMNNEASQCWENCKWKHLQYVCRRKLLSVYRKLGNNYSNGL